MLGLRPIGRHLITAIASAALLSACSGPDTPVTSSGGPLPDTKPAPPAVEWVDAVVPSGTTMKLLLPASIGSSISRKGDLFQATLSGSVKEDGSEVLPAGSVFRGFISQATPAAHGRDSSGGSLVLILKTVNTPSGAGASVSAEISEVGGGNTNPGVLSLASAPAAGKGGAAFIEGSRGKEILLDAGTELTIVLSEPLTIKVKK